MYNYAYTRMNTVHVEVTMHTRIVRQVDCLLQCMDVFFTDHVLKHEEDDTKSILSLIEVRNM